MTDAATIDRIEDVSLSPAGAELGLHVAPRCLASLPADVEWRGRLLGPRCRYAATVEVAYPVRPAGPGVLRVRIPEPNWWDPDAPFLYEGPVEAWHAGRLLARATVRHGLRTLRLTPRGLLVNGRPLRLRAALLPGGAAPLDALDRLRRAGCNAALVPLDDEAAWDAADAVGLLVLARAATPPEMARLAARLASGRHPSALAGLLPESLLASLPASLEPPPFGTLWGVERSAPGPAPLPPWIAFTAGPAVPPADPPADPPGAPLRPHLLVQSGAAAPDAGCAQSLLGALNAGPAPLQ